MAEEEGKFYVVLVEDSGNPTCIEAANKEELTKIVRDRVLEAVEPLWAYVFQGSKLLLQNPSSSCKIGGDGLNITVNGVGGGKQVTDRFVPLRYVRDIDLGMGDTGDSKEDGG